MVNPVLSGLTLEKLLKAARKYHDTGYNRSYIQIYAQGVRETLLCYPTEDSVQKLIRFTNSWRNRTPHSALPSLTKVLRRNVGKNERLRDAALEDTCLDDASLETVQNVFEDLCAVRDFGPTGASKFLGIIQPQLCVMWDDPIRKTLDFTGKTPRYAEYLLSMRDLAMCALTDSVNRGIAKPEEYISRRLGLSPYFTLATFVNHYVWVNITLPLRKKN